MKMSICYVLMVRKIMNIVRLPTLGGPNVRNAPHKRSPVLIVIFSSESSSIRFYSEIFPEEICLPLIPLANVSTIADFSTGSMM